MDGAGQVRRGSILTAFKQMYEGKPYAKLVATMWTQRLLPPTGTASITEIGISAPLGEEIDAQLTASNPTVGSLPLLAGGARRRDGCHGGGIPTPRRRQRRRHERRSHGQQQAAAGADGISGARAVRAGVRRGLSADPGEHEGAFGLPSLDRRAAPDPTAAGASACILNAEALTMQPAP